ncbi:cytochrome P450 [Myxococcus faecalis]|uniref:cytochrome P450 n=1 Tax=Myxococcus faecalis TaxID=3115646 RepID=UPI003CE8F428
MRTRLDCLSPEVIANLHAHLAELRRQGPIVQVDPGGMWAVTRYDEAQHVLKSPQLFSSTGMRLAFQPEWLGRANPLAESLPFLDPPQHGRLRTLILRDFTSAAIKRLEPRLRALTRERIARMMEQRTVDYMEAFAVPVPATVVCWLLGLDTALLKHFERWAHDIALIGGVHPEDTKQMEQCRRTLDEMERYVQDALDARRKTPGDDLMSDLLQARAGGQALTPQELMSFFFVLFTGGVETTTYLIGQSARMLCQHPELLSRLRETPTLIPRFVEETLRYEPSVVALLRTCLQDVTVADTALPKGSVVLVSLASAGRDEKVFPDGDRFILGRESAQHLTFGHGIHYCLGVMLARMEASIALEELIPHVSRMELRTERIDWTTSLVVRGPATLPVELFPA